MPAASPASNAASEPLRFMVDHNVARLARWLRMMGYDALVFMGEDDAEMVATALGEDRVILTRDRQVMQRRAIAGGKARAVLLQQDDPSSQLKQVVSDLGLKWRQAPFSVCLVDNTPLEPRTRDELRKALPAHVFKTHEQYMQCPACGRIYWRGTHWEDMGKRLKKMESS